MKQETIINAIKGAVASKGKNKGKLKKSAPKMNTPEHAAWTAIMSHANPYKVSFGSFFFMDDDNRKIYNQIDGFIINNKIDVRSMDVDRFELELLGAW